MEKIILLVHVIAAATVIGLVLLQHGKGADMGAAFGSGASGSLFGVSGSSNLLSRLTALFVAIFFVTSLTLAYLASHQNGQGSVIKSVVNTEKAPKKVEVGEVVLPTAEISTSSKSEVAPESQAEGPKDIPN